MIFYYLFLMMIITKCNSNLNVKQYFEILKLKKKYVNKIIHPLTNQLYDYQIKYYSLSDDEKRVIDEIINLLF